MQPLPWARGGVLLFVAWCDAQLLQHAKMPGAVAIGTPEAHDAVQTCADKQTVLPGGDEGDERSHGTAVRLEHGGRPARLLEQDADGAISLSC